jgi:hypothetical protein
MTRWFPRFQDVNKFSGYSSKLTPALDVNRIAFLNYAL